MPFLAPVFAGVGAAIGAVSAWAAASPILAGLVSTAFGIAAKFALAALFPPKVPSSASKLEVEYGADLVRSVGMGTYGTAGHFIYRNAFGKGNRQITDVYILSHFRTTAITKVRIKGEWRLLNGTPDANGFIPVQGMDNRIKVKFYNGTMGQAADPYLIATSNPAGRWTTNHRGAGISYAIVYQNLDREDLSSPEQPFFEVQGAPLYDVRLDSTAGGTGPQRWNNQNTWTYSENPVVQMYNLERGFFNGTELMVGKGTESGRLPVADWVVGMNICDEIVDSIRRYTSSLIATSGAQVTHDENIQPLLDACAGSWVENVNGEFPIVGAPQSITATIVDDDVAIDESFQISMKQPRVELINTVASTYVAPDSFYESVPATTRIDATALAEDRERLATSVTYAAVTVTKQVDRLADIAIRGARYQGTASICVHPKFLDTIKPGRWIRWDSDAYGDFTWQVVMRTLGPMGPNGTRNIFLSLRRIANGVFDPTAYITNPPNIPQIGVPEYLAEVENMVPTPNYVQADDGALLPGIRLQWNTIDDITVTGVLIQYRPLTDLTQVFTKTVGSDVTVVQLFEGLTSNSDWEIRTTLITQPKRPVAPSAWTLVRTFVIELVLPPIDLGGLGDDVKNAFQDAYDKIRELARQAQAQALLTGNQQLGDYQDRQEIRRQLQSTYQTTRAEYLEVVQVATGPNSAIATAIQALSAEVFDPVTGIPALATAITSLQSQVTVIDGVVTGHSSQITDLNISYNNVSANALFDMEAVAAPAGWTARIAMRVRVSTGDTFKQAGLYMDTTTSISRIALIADQIVMASGTDLEQPFVFTAGVLTLNAANIGTVTAGLLRSTDLKFQIQLNNKRLLIAD